MSLKGKTGALLLLCLALPAIAQLRGDIPVDPAKMKAGESACVFPYHHTAEDSIWLDPHSVYRRPEGLAGCIITIKKIGPSVWNIYVGQIPLIRSKAHDSELVRLGDGWIKLGSVSEVIVRR